MKSKNKLTLTFCNPDAETSEWAANKIRSGYVAELDKALVKAERALCEGRSARIKTKPLTIEIFALAKVKEKRENE
jgi:hypothetical protein